MLTCVIITPTLNKFYFKSESNSDSEKKKKKKNDFRLDVLVWRPVHPVFGFVQIYNQASEVIILPAKANNSTSSRRKTLFLFYFLN